MNFPDAFGLRHLSRNRINDLIVRERKFPCDVIAFADCLIITKATEDCLGHIPHINWLLQIIPIPKDRNHRRVAHKTDQPPHVAITGAAVDHRRAQDGVFQSAGFDGSFRGNTDFLALRIQLREDGRRADEDRALDSCAFSRADDRRPRGRSQGR